MGMGYNRVRENNIDPNDQEPSMAHRSTVFAQLLKFIPKAEFNKIVAEYDGDKRCRSLFCWDQFVAMLFAQLSGCSSLRDLIERLGSQKSRIYHLGINPIQKSSLADANHSRPMEIYYRLFFRLLTKLGNDSESKNLMRDVQLIDSTTISLCKAQFEWAEFRSHVAGIKLHTVYDPDADAPVYFQMTSAKVHDSVPVARFPVFAGLTYVFDRAYNNADFLKRLIDSEAFFVGRMKVNMRYTVLETREPEGDGVQSDELIRVEYKKKSNPLSGQVLRRIRFVREEDGKELVFMTNDLKRSAVDIAALYKKRWQIELFFKWIKQNLKIKRFFGTSENAVMIQVLIAMITYLLLRLVQEGMSLPISLQKIGRNLISTLMQRRTLRELFLPEKPNPYEDDNQLDLGLT